MQISRSIRQVSNSLDKLTKQFERLKDNMLFGTKAIVCVCDELSACSKKCPCPFYDQAFKLFESYLLVGRGSCKTLMQMALLDKLTRRNDKMAKFEIGDKVRLVKLDVRENACAVDMKTHLNDVGVIKYVDFDHYFVTFEDGKEFWTIPDWLLPVKTSNYRHKLVCVESNRHDYFTVGKVYKFDRGTLSDNTPRPWNDTLVDDNDLTYAQNVEDINKYFEGIDMNITFIEYVE